MKKKNFFISPLSIISDSATVSEVNDKIELETNSQEKNSDTNNSNLKEAHEILNIQPRDFNKHKNRLKKLTSSLDDDDINIGISQYKVTWLGDIKERKEKDKVTVSDINGLTSDIIEVFEKVQERELKMLKEFQTVFNTIDSLDKEYINAILINIAAIKKTNDNLNLTIEKQGQTISKLVSFKEKITDLTSESEKHEEQLLSLIRFKEKLEEIKKDSSDLNEEKIKLALLNYQEEAKNFQNEIEKRQQESFNKMSSTEKKISKGTKKAYLLAVISIIFAFLTFFFSKLNMKKADTIKSANINEIVSTVDNNINNDIEDYTSQLLPTESQPIQNVEDTNTTLAISNDINEEITLSSANFKKHKDEIKTFAESLDEKNIAISTIAMKKGLFGHKKDKVTVGEINEITAEITNLFTNIHERENQIQKEFNTIFNTFDSLDNEYINTILTNVNTIQKTLEEQEKDISEIITFHERIKNIENNSDSNSVTNQGLKSNVIDLQDNMKNLKDELLDYQKKMSELEQTNQQKLSDTITSIEETMSKKIRRAYFLAILALFFAFSFFVFSKF